jgi:hypothetical protein
LKPNGGGILLNICGESDRRRQSSMDPSGRAIPGVGSLPNAPIATAVDTCIRAVRTPRMRRRSQRTALGKVTSSPRSASAAASTLLTADATVTLSSIDTRRLGSLAARKSGNKLNVRRPSGQYHRAIRSPRGVLRG